MKAGNVDKEHILKLQDKIKRVKMTRVVEKVILFALFGIGEDVGQICGKYGIEIWDIEKVNNERKKIGLVRLKM